MDQIVPELVCVAQVKPALTVDPLSGRGDDVLDRLLTFAKKLAGSKGDIVRLRLPREEVEVSHCQHLPMGIRDVDMAHRVGRPRPLLGWRSGVLKDVQALGFPSTDDHQQVQLVVELGKADERAAGLKCDYRPAAEGVLADVLAGDRSSWPTELDDLPSVIGDEAA